MQQKKINLFKQASLGVLLFATPILAFGQTTDTTAIKEQGLAEVVLLGTRGAARTFTQSPVPVDVIEMKKLSSDAPQVSVNALLNYTVPSFTSTTQTVADGTDHIDPASLRGLGPDQTLVLLNGKRRHTTSLVNVNGTMGRGSVGTDLNAIPAMAIERLEVLRDGASAQYGSDAIAGVLNLGLRKNSSGTQVRVTGGGNVSTYQAYTEAGKGSYASDLAPKYVNRQAVDGGTIQVGINQGITLGRKKERGYLNLTGSFDARDYTNRAGEKTGSINNAARTGISTDQKYLDTLGRTRDDYRMRVGQSTLVGGQIFANFGYTLDEKSNMEVYAFGGVSYRYGTSAGFYRHPFDNRNILGVFPNGYLPIITSKIFDVSFAVGLRGKLARNWNYDISNTFGTNSFGFGAENLVNASSKNPNNYLHGRVDGLDSNKTTFDAGGLAFVQNTTNFDISRNFNVLGGLNVAGGLEFRTEQYQQIAGETASWANYNARSVNQKSTDPVDIYGTVLTTSYLENDTIGVPLGGSNVFPGFRPNVDFARARNSFAVYLDFEQNFAKWLVVDVAGRYENYSDFGSNFSGKAAARVNPFKWLAIRGSISSGFRAPSLHQRYIAKTSSVLVGGVPTEQAIFNNSSIVAQSVGISSLKPETSFSYSAGLTLNFNKFKFTVDAYTTNIYDRIILTDPFTDTPGSNLRTLIAKEGANTAAFFSNAIDTRNSGIDAVVSYSSSLPNQQRIRIDLSGTISQVELVGDVKSFTVLPNYKHYYLSPVNKALMTEAFPRAKFNLIVNYTYQKWNFFFRGSYVGGVTHLESVSGRDSVFFRQKLSPLFVTDLSISYNISKKVRVTAGVNNLFDIYPDIISASKGEFFKLETNPNSPNYNTIKQDHMTAKQINRTVAVANDDGLTSANQFVYSRRTSQIGLNGRFLFLRVEINL